MKQIALIGPGAIGGTVAAWLAQSSELAVTVCARTPFDRLEIETPDGRLTATPEILTEPARARTVFRALRQWEIPSAAKRLTLTPVSGATVLSQRLG